MEIRRRRGVLKIKSTMTQEQSISATLEQLFEVAEKNIGKHDISNAIGEVTIKGVTYQMQIQLVCDKKVWLKENEVRFQEVTKIH
jgi:hypothetical protein